MCFKKLKNLFWTLVEVGGCLKWDFSISAVTHWSHSKNFTSLLPLIFLSKQISLYASGRLKWILDIIWPLNQHFKLKNQRNWLNKFKCENFGMWLHLTALKKKTYFSLKFKSWTDHWVEDISHPGVNDSRHVEQAIIILTFAISNFVDLKVS